MSYKITEKVGEVSITYEAPTIEEVHRLANHDKESGIAVSSKADITISTEGDPEISAQDVIDVINASKKFSEPKTLTDIIPEIVEKLDNFDDFISVNDYQIQQSSDWQDNSVYLTFDLKNWHM